MFNQNQILEIMNEQLQTDEIKNYVAEKVKSTIKSSIDDQFRFYADKGNDGYRTINKAVSDVIGLNLKELKLPEFQVMLINTINQLLLHTINNDAKINLEENIKKLLITDKKEYSIKELIYEFLNRESLLEEYQQEIDNDFNADCCDSTLQVEDLELSSLLESDVFSFDLKKSDNERWLTISFGQKSQSKYSTSDKYDYEIRLHKLRKGETEYSFGWARIGGKDFKDQTLFKELPRWFDALMFKIFCGSVVITVSEKDLEDFEEE